MCVCNYTHIYISLLLYPSKTRFSCVMGRKGNLELLLLGQEMSPAAQYFHRRQRTLPQALLLAKWKITNRDQRIPQIICIAFKVLLSVKTSSSFFHLLRLEFHGKTRPNFLRAPPEGFSFFVSPSRWDPCWASVAQFLNERHK